MENLHLRVIAVVLCFHLPGSVGTKPWQILDTHHGSDCRWDGELLLNCSLTGASALPEDIPQTAVTADFSYNNIKTFLCPDGRDEEWMLKHLNLSNNLLSELTLTACRSLPGLETLNLDGNAIHTLTLDIATPARGSNRGGKVACLLPALKVLSVEGNKLKRVPRGLGLLQSLQTVHLTANGIEQIELNDFQNCSQLKDINLRKNNITEIHPDAFRDLQKLQVVDLRDNALTTPLPQIFLTLNFFQLEVDLSGKAWIFNCELSAFKQLFDFLLDSRRQKMSISYNKSATNSQKPLLCLSSFQCNHEEDIVLKRAAVPTGKTSVLNCALDNTRGNGVSWWTPKGRISKESHFPHMTLDKTSHLVIQKAEKAAEGLYLCAVHTKHLIYSVEVKERLSPLLVRAARDTDAAFRRGSTEQDLALAVCLSVFITFVCAFCLGAFARPYLVNLWRLLHRNKSSGSEHTYSNQAFSDETWSRACSASSPTNTQHNLFSSEEGPSRNTQTSALYGNVTGGSVHAPNSAKEYQKQSNNGVSVKEEPEFADLTTSVSHNRNADADENGLLSVRTGYQNTPEVAPRKLTSKDTSSWNNSNCANSEDSERSRFPPLARRLNTESNHTDSSNSPSSFLGETGFPSSTTQAPDSRKSKASPSSGLLQPGITEATPNLWNLSVNQRAESSPLTESNCKTEHTGGKAASAAVFGDSSSDEGTPFTMSDCSSLSDFELDHHDVSDHLPACQLSLGEANTKSGIEKSPTLAEPAKAAAELQPAGGNEDENNAWFETTTGYGSGTTMPETASPSTDKCDGHLSMAASDTVSSTQVPDDFPHAESTTQNSDSLCNPSTGFIDLLLSLKHCPSCETDAENTPQEAESQLYQFPIEPQHSLSFSPTGRTENASEGGTDKHIARNSSERNHGGGEIRLGRQARVSEDSGLIFAPIDTGLNECVKETSLLHSSSETSHQPLPEHTAESYLTVTTEKEDFLPQGKQVSTAEACADRMAGGFQEKAWDGCTELEDASSCGLPQETQPCILRADLLHLGSFMKTQSGYHTQDHFQQDQSDEDEISFSAPQAFCNRSTQYSSWPLPQKTTRDSTSGGPDSSKLGADTAWTGLKRSSTAAVNLQHPSEELTESQPDSGQGQFFLKKKRAFDGFVNVLQSRRTNFSSWDSNV
ncbi:leucine-rich repeat-containing protein 66 [Melanerpes formicivorus]|uniref:leucine-rich repeat-containing protein 66 n=1 Tax=Melanerpes formicivorus TaxID=211600 RepID=UPI00358FF4D6